MTRRHTVSIFDTHLWIKSQDKVGVDKDIRLLLLSQSLSTKRKISRFNTSSRKEYAFPPREKFSNVQFTWEQRHLWNEFPQEDRKVENDVLPAFGPKHLGLSNHFAVFERNVFTECKEPKTHTVERLVLWEDGPFWNLKHTLPPEDVSGSWHTGRVAMFFWVFFFNNLRHNAK